MPVHRSRYLALSTIVLLGCAIVCAEETTTTQFAQRIQGTPDLPQINELLPGRGGQYCGPVSASNALAWLSEQGYPKLMSGPQVELAKLLGSEEFMNTSVKSGTGSQAIAHGMSTYIKQCGYEIDELLHQGWKNTIKEPVTKLPGHANVPDIAERFSPTTVALLCVGWYKRAGEDYERQGGHWVTLVGIEPGEPAILLIHDPGSRSDEGVTERVTASRIRSGRLTGKSKGKGLPIQAVDAWELGGELKISRKKGAETAVLDGVVLLRLK